MMGNCLLTWIITGPTAQVDILILCRRDSHELCKKLAKYLGLIFLEDVVREIEKENPKAKKIKYEDLLNLLSVSNSKVYRPLQERISRKIMFGYNSVCITCNPCLYRHIFSNVKAIIIDDSSDKSTFVDLYEHSNFIVHIENNVFQYISALSEILNIGVKIHHQARINILLLKKL